MMEQSLPDITHFSEYPLFSISSGYNWGAHASLSEHNDLLSFTQYYASTLAQHSGGSHHCYCHAFTSTPLCCLWRNLPGHGISSHWSPQVTACNLRKWPLKSKHDLCYKHMQESKTCCSSLLYLLLTAYNPHVAPETLSALILGGIWEAWAEPGWWNHRMGCYFLEVNI